jgi:hypothetical protein
LPTVTISFANAAADNADYDKITAYLLLDITIWLYSSPVLRFSIESIFSLGLVKKRGLVVS